MKYGIIVTKSVYMISLFFVSESHVENHFFGSLPLALGKLKVFVVGGLCVFATYFVGCSSSSSVSVSIEMLSSSSSSSSSSSPWSDKFLSTLDILECDSKSSSSYISSSIHDSWYFTKDTWCDLSFVLSCNVSSSVNTLLKFHWSIFIIKSLCCWTLILRVVLPLDSGLIIVSVSFKKRHYFIVFSSEWTDLWYKHDGKTIAVPWPS